MKEKYKYIFAFILLLGFIFNFAHSELGFMTPEGDEDHHTHDFCQLASAATAKNHNAAVSFAQNIAQPRLSMVCIIPEAIPVLCSLQRQAANSLPHDSGSSGVPLFVFNRTLLI